MASTHLFLTHNWGNDSRTRNNHVRVSCINKELQKQGWVTWFDDERMCGDIREKMAAGIDDTKIVIVFITDSYRKKVNGNDSHDNCRLEYRYAVKQKPLISVVMETEMRDDNNWKGVLGLHLAGHLYIDMSADFTEGYVREKVVEISNLIVKTFGTDYRITHPVKLNNNTDVNDEPITNPKAPILVSKQVQCKTSACKLPAKKGLDGYCFDCLEELERKNISSIDEADNACSKKLTSIESYDHVDATPKEPMISPHVDGTPKGPMISPHVFKPRARYSGETVKDVEKCSNMTMPQVTESLRNNTVSPRRNVNPNIFTPRESYTKK